jgi:hypothetical protein
MNRTIRGSCDPMPGRPIRRVVKIIRRKIEWAKYEKAMRGE